MAGISAQILAAITDAVTRALDGITRYPAISYDLRGAENACGLSVSEIQKAINEGDLVANYRGRKPLIRAAELDAWVASLPTTKPGAR